MSPELEQKLVEKYPILFRDAGKSPQESCMAWGVDFGDGWYKIFEELCEYLTRFCKQEEFIKLKKEHETKENHGFLYVKRPNVVFSQVKEKFGTMRIYWVSKYPENWNEVCEKTLHEEKEKSLNYFYRKVDAALDYVEFLSSKTCELCGQPGKLYTKGWHKVRCEECYR